MRQFTSYQAAVNSFPLSEARVGLLKPGRYSGFDQMAAGSGSGDISIVISHSVSTIPNITSDNTVGDLEGTVLTPQGVVIKASETFPLPIANNTTLAIRYDLVYLQYTWADDVLGGEALVGIIQGTVNGVVPALSSHTQILLGIVTVPEDATYSNLIYTPAQVPLPGGSNIVTNFPELDLRYARLAETNRFLKTQSLNYAASISAIDADGHIILGEAGNTFEFTGNPSTVYNIHGFIPATGRTFPVGTKITMLFASLGAGSTLDTVDSTLGQSIGMSYLWPDLPPFTPVPVVSGELYEFTLLSAGTWLATANPTRAWWRDLDLANDITNIYALLGAATTWKRVNENGDGGAEFTTNFTSAAHVEDVALRYRRSLGDVLEITGNFNTAADCGLGVIPVFTLPLDYRPGRSLAFPVYVISAGGTGAATHYNGYIDDAGILKINFPGVTILTGTRISIEISLPR